MNHRALLIDAATGVISEVVVNDYQDIQRLIGCRCFTAVRLTKDETLYVDDEGLINGTEHGFRVAYGDRGWLAGNGLVLGNTEWGDSASTKLSVDDLKGFGITHAVELDSGVSTPVRSAATLN